MDPAPLLSILDLVPVRPDRDAGDAIRATLRLAELADELGYHRYWLAEHHGSSLLACPSPEILVGQVAARTSRLRVGTGGVLLTHYSPLKVAESFRILEAIFPGRIDLGICRATSAGRTADASSPTSSPPPPNPFPRRVADLMSHLANGAGTDRPAPEPQVLPAVRSAPAVWLLGSGTESARVAATLGAAFSFAHFLRPDIGAAVIGAYFQAFTPSVLLARPSASLAVAVVCHEREDQARRLFDRDAVYSARLELGLGHRYPALEEVARERFTQDELALVERERSRTIVGTPEQVRDRLLELAAEHGVSELVLRSTSPDAEVRERSYAAIAQACNLVGTRGEAA